GFVFTEDRREVVLVRKNRPAWQAGFLNGVGGKVERGEVPVAAMAREFAEEAGVSVDPSAWDELCTVTWPERGAPEGFGAVVFFRHVWDRSVPLGAAARSCTDEPIELWPVDAALRAGPVVA